jgi:DNA-binding NarL/FixJ family response regulator
MKRIRVLVAESFRGVSDLFGSSVLTGPSFEVIGVVDDGRELVRQVEALRPDVAFVTCGLAHLNGLEAIRAVRMVNRTVKIICMTVFPEPRVAKRALLAGASGFLVKLYLSDEIENAVRDVLAGRRYISPRVAEEALKSLENVDEESLAIEDLTPIEREVLRMSALERSSWQIAGTLRISWRAVRHHKKQLLKRFRLKEQEEVTQFVYKHGFLSCS